jgi:hypothetical protein
MGQTRVRAKSFLSGLSSDCAASGAREAEEQKIFKLAVRQGYRQDGLKATFHWAQSSFCLLSLAVSLPPPPQSFLTLFTHPVTSLGAAKQFGVHSKGAGPKGAGPHPSVCLSGLPSTAYTR